MKKVILPLLMVGAFLAMGLQRRTINVGSVEGYALHAIQSDWEIADSTTSAGTEPNALGDTERTKLLVDAAITAAASGDDEISTYVLPSKWSRVRFRAIGITDAATRTDQIYFGSLGAQDDCELTYSGQLAWTIGKQTSIYDQITFTSGGTYEPQAEETVTGNTNGETAVVVSVTLSSGAWADGDAAGTITYKSASGAFASGETVKIVDPFGVTQSDVLTHAASDLVDFELADSLTITAKTGIWETAVNPADDTNAEAEIDVKGADYLVIVASTSSVDTKLLIKGY
jgi:hypothetical protein